VLALGVVIVAGHNLLDAIQVQPWMGPDTPVPSALGKLWCGLHRAASSRSPAFRARSCWRCTPLPWIGVIAMGYGFSESTAGPRSGAAAADRARRGDGGLRSWSCDTRTATATRCMVAAGRRGEDGMSFFNVQKYGPSLLFALVTLVPAMLALGLLDGRTLGSGLGGVLVTFGRVPLFFYACSGSRRTSPASSWRRSRARASRPSS
jgi:uncharacterized membrane protein